MVAERAMRDSPYEFSLQSATTAAKLASNAQERLSAARHLLLAGDIDAALTLLNDSMPPEHSPLYRGWLRWQSIAYLRQAEQQNCLDLHNASSCVLPLLPSAEHQIKPAAKAAIAVNHKRLALDANDIEARWLLNLAHMYLGQHPDQVPVEFLVPADAFDRSPSPAVFTDRAQALGVDVIGRAGGVVFDDFNGDHYPDLLISDWGIGAPLRLFLNDQGEGFIEHTERAGLAAQWGGLNLISADYDNDGDLDALVLRGAWMGPYGQHPNSLLQNDGNGRFVDVTEQAGLLQLAPTQTAVFADVNLDGWLDLAVGHESVQGSGHPSLLFLNTADGRFERQTLPLNGFVKALVAGDVDNDGDVDLYASLLDQPNRLLINEGGQFSAAPSTRHDSDGPDGSFPAWFFDYNNDGWLDLFVSGYPTSYQAARVDDSARDYLGLDYSLAPPVLLENRQDGTFRDVAVERGLAHALLTMGANYGDIDNDGRPDMYLGTGAPDLATLVPNRMFLNRPQGFLDITGSARVGHLQKGHGVAFADFDFDGDLDIYHVLGGAVTADIYPNALFVNPGTENNWVNLRLVGEAANRSAIGARIKVTAADGSVRHAVVGTGGSFGASSLSQHIGLADATAPLSLEVRWPDQAHSSETLTLNQLNRHYRVVQGQDAALLTP